MDFSSTKATSSEQFRSKPWLIVRESVFYHILWTAIFLILVPVIYFFGEEHKIPTKVILLSLSGVGLILLIQIFLLSKVFNSNNWLLKVLPEGLLLKPKAYNSNSDSPVVFIPRSAIQEVLEKQEIRSIRKKVASKNRMDVYSFDYLEILVDKSRLEELHGELGKVKKPRPVFSVGFDFTPITKTESGYRIEFSSHRSRLNTSLPKLAEVLRTKWALMTKKVRKSVSITEEMADEDFKREIKRLGEEGMRTDAIGAIRHRYSLNPSQANEKFEQILSDSKSITP